MPRVSIRRLLLALLAALALVVVVLNWTYARLPAEPTPTGSFIQVGGLRIHYLERPGTGTPVVLIHGLPGTAEDWNEVTPLLAGHRTVAFDRPGFGYSSGGYVPFGRQVQTLHELLGALHISKPVLVGHSYGGTLALGFAERYPGAVRGLVLVDAAAGQGPPRDNSFARLEAHALRILELPVIWQLADVTFSQLLRTVSAEMADSEAFSPQPVAAAHRERVLAINMTRGNLQALAGEYLAADGVIAQINRGLGTIKVPSVVIQGAQDKFVLPVYGRHLAGELPDARLVMVPGGHMAPYTHPRVIAAAVGSVAGVSAQRGAKRPRAVSCRRGCRRGGPGS
jgi:pimeloyl-ACP methyl ester carboxylesterase